MEFETFEDDECNGDCSNCSECEDDFDEEIPCTDCVTDMYVHLLEDVDCPHCRKELLTHFFFDMVESISNQVD